jgi:hypothetical protein
MATLREAGCIGVSNAGKPLQDALVTEALFRICRHL